MGKFDRIFFDEQRLAKLAGLGWSQGRIAEAMEVSKGTIARNLRRLGITRNPDLYKKIRYVTRHEIIRLRATGLHSMRAIAEALTVSLSFVHMIIEENKKDGRYEKPPEEHEKVVIPFREPPKTLPSESAIRLAQFDPVVRRALSLRISEMAETEIPATLAAILSTSDGVPSRGPPPRA